MKKKIITICLFLLTFYFYSNDFGLGLKNVNENRINVPRRYFEMSTTADVGASNNYFAAEDILVEELIFDLKKIATELPTKGFSFNTYSDVKYAIDFNHPDGMHFGFETGIDFYCKGTISKALFEFLGHGNKLNEPLTFDGKAIADLFLYTNVTAGFDFLGFHAEITPTLFAPILHGESKDLYAKFENNSNGTTVATASAGTTFYSSMNLKPYFDNNFDFSDFNALDAFSEMENYYGFDLALSLEHKIFDTLQGAAYTRIPIVPGKLVNSTSLTTSIRYEVKSIFDMIMGTTDSATKSTEYSGLTYNSSEYYLHRPFKMGAQAVWRPFGKWCTFNSLLGFAVRNPFSSDAEFFMEYDFGVNFTILHILGFDISTSYENQIFMHSVGVILNFRLIEVNASVVCQGGNFVQSFKGTGAGCVIAVKIGF